MNAFLVSLKMLFISKGHIAFLTFESRSKMPQSQYMTLHDVKAFS
ncbi:MAG TPA: hypothetical protein VD699_06360 [Nitrosopumilaceae archaeon]|nr:hypothetical protein [Nitrosopumilaceae archaeon]HXV39173.1 hypothetical protein [Nitrosopumilaceae archaeon]